MTARATAYRWQVVAMLWLVCFFNYADRQAIYAVFPLLGQEFHFDKYSHRTVTRLPPPPRLAMKRRSGPPPRSGSFSADRWLCS